MKNIVVGMTSQKRNKLHKMILVTSVVWKSFTVTFFLTRKYLILDLRTDVQKM